MTFLSSLIGSKAALATVAIGALALGGAGIAFAETASTNDDVISATSTAEPTETEAPDENATDAPDPTETEAPSDANHGPDATGSAAYGLCNAFAHGGLSTNSTAYASLETAAIAAFVVEATSTTATGDTTTADPTGTETSAPTDVPALTTTDLIHAYCGTVAKPGSGHANEKSAKDHSNSHKPEKSSKTNSGSQKDKTTHGTSGQSHGKGAQSSDD
jgi:hypothetical protein